VVLLDGFDTAAIGYIAPSLVSEWGIERSALGPVLSAALFGLVVGSLSAGPLADRFGRKTILSISVRVPTKPAMHSNLKPAGYSDRKPATLGVNRMGRFDDVVEG